MAAKDDFLLETMLDMGLTTHEAVEEVRPEAESSGEGVVDTLVKTGRLEASLVVMAKSTYFGVEMVNLAETRLTDEVINAVPSHVARKYNAVPVASHDGTVVVALADPSDIDIGHRQLRGHGEPLALGEPCPQFVDGGLAVPAQIGAALTPAGG